MTLSLPLASLSRGDWISLGYLVAIISFILALRFLSDPARARNGNLIGAFGMAVAILATFFQPGLKNIAAIVIVMVITAPIGAYAARAVKMTAMPQMVALFNGVGGGAAALIAFADFHGSAPPPDRLPLNGSVAIVLSAMIGSISFAGSMIAFAKLQELIGGRPIQLPFRAWAGLDRKRSARMKLTMATMYASEIQSPRLRLASGKAGVTRACLPPPGRARACAA